MTSTAAAIALEPPPAAPSEPAAARQVFVGSLLYTAVLSLVWLFFVLTQRDGGVLFRRYNLDAEAVGRVVVGFLVFWVGWSWVWYRLKRALLRRSGFSPGELTTVFESRMGRPFDLAALLAKHSERRIRVVDMICRRGRTVSVLLLAFLFLYAHISKDPKPDSLAMGIQDNVFDAILFNWFNLAAYYSSGLLGRLAYGAHSRIMDGTAGRANVLLIGMLWSLFKFVMIPLGLQLGTTFPPATYGTLFAFIWVSYLVSDSLSEVVGSLFGRQKLRVWGLGEVNRKSVAGTWACFLGSLAVCLAVVQANHLPPAWLGLALVVSLSNTALELFSPRGTDDFTMATGNALLCWGFGVLYYS